MRETAQIMLESPTRLICRSLLSKVMHLLLNGPTQPYLNPHMTRHLFRQWQLATHPLFHKGSVRKAFVGVQSYMTV